MDLGTAFFSAGLSGGIILAAVLPVVIDVAFRPVI